MESPVTDRPALRIGVRRAPDASPLAVVAEIEARVLHAELGRRLGHVTLDLRTDGPAVGPWAPLAHAAWPGGIDAELDAGRLVDGGVAPLTALFARTVAPDAAEVRERMLRHLGVLPLAGALDDDTLDALVEQHVRPTDLWLIARTATATTCTETTVHALADQPGVSEVAALDARLDEVAGQLSPAGGHDRTVARLAAEVADLRAQLDAAVTHASRLEREAADRITRLDDELALLRERLARAELDGPAQDG